MTFPSDSQTAESEEFIGSREQANNKYGQNGYLGASSDLPGQKTRMNRDYGLDADPSADAGNWQTRKVSQEQYPTTFGIKAKADVAKVPDANIRRATKQAAPGSFQR
jgi:hypothetical protein